MSRELDKGETSHDLSRFLSFGKEGAMRGHEFPDQLHTPSCLSILHNPVVAWNRIQIGKIVSYAGKDIRSRTKRSSCHSASSQAHQPVRVILLRLTSHTARPGQRT
jgi:TnpA family transposase